jgi:LacI family transcriptional regulator
VAIGAISTLEDNGFKVPSDISVLGFDDVLLSRYSRPKLSTLHYPIEEMAMQATNIGLDLANKQTPDSKNEKYKHIPMLVKRKSTTFKSN